MLSGAYHGANAQIAQANSVCNQGSTVSLDATGIIIKVLRSYRRRVILYIIYHIIESIIISFIGWVGNVSMI